MDKEALEADGNTEEATGPRVPIPQKQVKGHGPDQLKKPKAKLDRDQSARPGSHVGRLARPDRLGADRLFGAYIAILVNRNIIGL